MGISFLKLYSSFGFAGSLRFPGVLGFHERFQIGQAVHPEAAVLLDPGVDGTKRFGIEFVKTVTAFAVFADQVRTPQQAQVFGDGGARDGEGIGNLAGWLAAASQHVEHGAAGGIGKGLKGRFRPICHRTVTHNV
jgi:hypothetical protein